MLGIFIVPNTGVHAQDSNLIFIIIFLAIAVTILAILGVRLVVRNILRAYRRRREFKKTLEALDEAKKAFKDLAQLHTDSEEDDENDKEKEIE